MKNTKLFKQQTGGSTLITFLSFVGIILGVYLFIKLGPPYIGYMRVRQALKKAVTDSAYKESAATRADELRYQIESHLKSIEAPIGVNDVAVTQVGNTVVLDANYSVTVNHLLMEPQIIAFNPHVEFQIKSNE